MSYLPQAGVWDTIKKIGGGALDVVKEQSASEAQAEAYRQMAMQQAMQQKSSMPPWLLPVGLGAGALVLFLALKK
jgi:hypothetical protein